MEHEKLNDMHHLINQLEKALRGFCDQEWIIWGCGLRGKCISEVMRECGFNIVGFVDNDSSKWNTIVAGIPCFERTKLNEKQYYILVSPEKSQNLYLELCEQFDYVFSTEIASLLNRLLSPKKKGYRNFFPIGHYYDPYPDLVWVREQENTFVPKYHQIYDINFNFPRQNEIIKNIKGFFSNLPLWEHNPGNGKYRYYYGNSTFSIEDAIVLHSMIKQIQPKRIVEIGSGYSSAVILDTNEFYSNDEIELTFIEPYPERLKSILKSETIILHEVILQNVDIGIFLSLQKDDILFIDSTHVSKRNSDVNRIIFEILPQLASGVYIHFHDILPDFEYPFFWLEQGRVYNEAYILRAFLQYNNAFEVQFSVPMMSRMLRPIINKKYSEKSPTIPSSFWLKKV